MVTNLQGQTVSRWLSFSLVGIFLKQEIIELFGNFHSQAIFEKSLNATFLAFIPKKVDAVNVRDFRPISLVGSIYNILSKVLANRLKRVTSGIISETQNAFGLDRQILDSVLIANECLDSRQKARVPRVLCKLDVEKAFDHVSWDFLMYMLQRCGFSEQWSKWILFCISKVKFFFPINGSPKDFFGSSRGLCQGDPLSPLLFVIVMEVLSRLLDGVVLVGHISRFTIGPRYHIPLMVSHLLFADDTLIFNDTLPSQIGKLRDILSSFEAVSGLHISLAKSDWFQLVRC